MIIVHYEVYVLEGRGWMLHARFPRTERETAIAEAKELEQTLRVRVRVLRETYYTEDNSFDEADIYTSPGVHDKMKPAAAKPAGASRPAASGTARPRSSSAPATPARPAPPPPRRPATAAAKERKGDARAHQLFARLLAITALALAAALLSIKVTPDAIMLLWSMGFNLTITPTGYGQLLFGIFVTVFLLVAVPLALRFLPHQTAVPQFSKPSLSWGRRRPAAAASADPARDRAVKKSLDKLAAEALAQEARFGNDSAEDKDAGDDIPDLAALELPEILPGPAESAPEAPREPDPPATRAEREKKESTVTAESLQPSVMRFLDGAVAQARTLVPNMDAFTKFALHLYMAGAVETLCDFKKVGDGAKVKLVATALETLGTSGDLARKFYDKLEEYLLEPRYLGVVQAGRDAMGDFMLGDEAGAHRALRDAILEWTRKSDKKAQIVTVMFTDMVGSTDMTQARGDAAAQEVVRRHNSIVRGALAQFGGKEIKHTGDGIMASFHTAAAAVEATVSIQRQVDQHNQRLPTQALHLRIGLNAGEPIEEEDDLFGATVQLAARVCAATNADQVLCTAVVKDLTTGKGAATFRPVGEKYLKGFKEAVPLFEVMWNS